MIRNLRLMHWVMVLAMTLLCTGRAHACAACFGQADSPLADGLNWGILVLLLCVWAVLAGIIAFFVFASKRAAMLAARSAAVTATPEKTC